MITPSLPAVCGVMYGVSGGSLYPSTSGSFLVSAEESGNPMHFDNIRGSLHHSGNRRQRRRRTPGAAAAFAGRFYGRHDFRRRHLLGAWRQRDMGVTKQIGDRLGDVGAHQPVVAAMADAYMLQAIEVAQKRLPFRHDAGLA